MAPSRCGAGRRPHAPTGGPGAAPEPGAARASIPCRGSAGSYRRSPGSALLLLVPCEPAASPRLLFMQEGLLPPEISQRCSPRNHSPARAMWRVEFKDRAHSPGAGQHAKERRLGRAPSKQELPAGRGSLAKEPVYAPGDPDSCPLLRPHQGPSAAPRDWPGARGRGLYPQGSGLLNPNPSPCFLRCCGPLPLPSPSPPLLTSTPVPSMAPCRGPGAMPRGCCVPVPASPGQRGKG